MEIAFHYRKDVMAILTVPKICQMREIALVSLKIKVFLIKVE
jgi:hypothetical protein